MFQKQVVNKDGVSKTVVAASEEDLNEAVSAIENQVAPTVFDINVPVRKGHDLVTMDEDANLTLEDGRGVHNSPRDAVRDDNKMEGDPKVPYVVADRDAIAGVELKKVVSEGKVADLTDKDRESMSTEVNSPTAADTKDV